MWKISGFDHLKSFFEKTLAGDSLSHAYLFMGQDMIGKRTFAEELAAKIASPADIMELTSHDIDSVRGVKQFLSLTAFQGTKKVVIIDNADQLAEDAQNALLK